MKCMKRILGILLSMALVLGQMLGMSLTAWATTGTYSSLIPTESDDETALSGKVVHFNNFDWYIIEDNSTAVDAGTVTLFAKDPIGASKFHDSSNYLESSNVYGSSTVMSYLEGLTKGNGSFADVAYVIVGTDLSDVSVIGAKLWLLSVEEVRGLSENVRKCSQAAESYEDVWWLRSPGPSDDSVSVVFGGNGNVIDEYSFHVGSTYGVRPALKLNLSAVVFSSETNTFSLNHDTSTYEVTYKVVNGTWSDDSTEDKTETVLSGLKTYDVPTGMKPNFFYKDGAWDANPVDVTITESMTFTYTFVSKQYSDLIPTGSEDETDLTDKVVHFNDLDWYIIEDDSITMDSGTVTLFAKDPIGASIFHESSKVYSNSVVKSYLDDLTTANGYFADVEYAIVGTDLSDASVTGAKLWLLSAEEAGQLCQNVLKCTQASGTNSNKWWLRSPDNILNDYAKCVGGTYGFGVDKSHVGNNYGVRPAMKLDLSAVNFTPETNTFSLNPDVSTYEVTYKVVNGTWSDDTTEDKTESVPSGSNPASVPSGMKANSGYTGGAWDTDPTDVTITGETTFTYTFTEEESHNEDTAYRDYEIILTEDSTSLENKKVVFNGKPWYIIKDNSTSKTEGSVTLLAADTSFGVSQFNNKNSKAYSDSKIANELATYTNEGGSFYNVADAINEVKLSDADNLKVKLYLPSRSEIAAFWASLTLRMKFNNSAVSGQGWWLRSPGTDVNAVEYVDGDFGDVNANGSFVAVKAGVRPALQLNLSYVDFSSDTKTFSLKPSYEVTYKVVNGTWSDDSTADKTETVLSGSKPANVPTGMKASSGYTGGDWDTDPSDATITGATTFTYTFTAEELPNEDTAYGDYVVNSSDNSESLTNKTVIFNGKPWHIIEDNSTSTTEGSVTLLAADTSFGVSQFNASYSNVYSGSKIATTLAAYTNEGGSFHNVTDAINEVTLSDADNLKVKLYIPSQRDISSLSVSTPLIMQFSDSQIYEQGWWLRTPAYDSDRAMFVDGRFGGVYTSGTYVDNMAGVRPALQLNLSYVDFSSNTKTFSLKPSYEVTYKVVNGTWEDDSTADKTETVLSGSKPTSVPTGMKASSGYTGGAWDTDPAEATITGATTFTYTFTAVPSYEITYKVVNGTWSDDSTTDKTETVQSGSKPTSVPTGMKASSGYTSGAWDTDPAEATITEATTFTYTFTSVPSYEVKYKVVNGTWSDDSTEDKTETVQSGSKPSSVPTGMKAGAGYTSGAWDTDPVEATITRATTFTYTFTSLPSHEVKYKVVNGTWSDDGTTDKKETVQSGSKPSNVPTGMKASTGYTGGAWDTNPAETTITGAKTFTYTFTAKQSATVIKAPKAKTLTYNGSEQALVTAGEASGGEMQYALGTTTKATEAYTTSIPAKTDAGTYHVWYKAVGDESHTDSNPKVILVTIKERTETHNHDIKEKDALEPTCTEEGYKKHYECAECGKWFEDVTGSVEITDKDSFIIKAKDHKWDDGVVTKEASYNETGIKTYTCLNDSSHTKEESIPKKKRSSGSVSSSSSSSSTGGSSSKHHTTPNGRFDNNNSKSYSIPENHQVEAGVPASDVGGSWGSSANADTWTYTKSDGTLAKSEWLSLDYNGLRYWYYFNDDGNMLTDWFDYNGERFYLMPDKDGWRGRMATGWKKINNKWYYFDIVPGKSQGRLYRSSVTPDGHVVGADGAWDGIGGTPVGQE